MAAHVVMCLGHSSVNAQRDSLAINAKQVCLKTDSMQRRVTYQTTRWDRIQLATTIFGWVFLCVLLRENRFWLVWFIVFLHGCKLAGNNLKPRVATAILSFPRALFTGRVLLQSLEEAHLRLVPGMIAFSTENEGRSVPMRISAQNERSKPELLFLSDASKLQIAFIWNIWGGASPHIDKLKICANKRQINARHGLHDSLQIRLKCKSWRWPHFLWNDSFIFFASGRIGQSFTPLSLK